MDNEALIVIFTLIAVIVMAVQFVRVIDANQSHEKLVTETRKQFSTKTTPTTKEDLVVKILPKNLEQPVYMDTFIHGRFVHHKLGLSESSTNSLTDIESRKLQAEVQKMIPTWHKIYQTRWKKRPPFSIDIDTSKCEKHQIEIDHHLIDLKRGICSCFSNKRIPKPYVQMLSEGWQFNKICPQFLQALEENSLFQPSSAQREMISNNQRFHVYQSFSWKTVDIFVGYNIPLDKVVFAYNRPTKLAGKIFEYSLLKENWVGERPVGAMAPTLKLLQTELFHSWPDLKYGPFNPK